MTTKPKKKQRAVINKRVDPDLLKKAEDIIKETDPKYRGFSHFLEVALSDLIKKEEAEKKG